MDINYITPEIVIAFIAGAVTDPKLYAAIEEARYTDPEVQYWFDLYDPDYEEEDEDEEEIVDTADDSQTHPPVPNGNITILDPAAFAPVVSEHALLWPLAALDPNPPPTPDHSTDLPSHRIDTRTESATLKYPAESIPFGVARVVVKLPDREKQELGSTLVVFRKFRRKDSFVRVAEVSCAALGLTATKPPRVYLYVIPATKANLAEFSPEEVRTLRDACNGDHELRAPVEELLSLLEIPRR